MSKTVTIEGREFSEDTVKAALQAHCDWKEAEYIFQVGDVVRMDEYVRIIVRENGKLKSFDLGGKHCTEGQRHFVANGYRKIGRIFDYITTTKFALSNA